MNSTYWLLLYSHSGVLNDPSCSGGCRSGQESGIGLVDCSGTMPDTSLRVVAMLLRCYGVNHALYPYHHLSDS